MKTIVLHKNYWSHIGLGQCFSTGGLGPPRGPQDDQYFKIRKKREKTIYFYHLVIFIVNKHFFQLMLSWKVDILMFCKWEGTVNIGTIFLSYFLY